MDIWLKRGIHNVDIHRNDESPFRTAESDIKQSQISQRDQAQSRISRYDRAFIPCQVHVPS